VTADRPHLRKDSPGHGRSFTTDRENEYRCRVCRSRITLARQPSGQRVEAGHGRGCPLRPDHLPHKRRADPSLVPALHHLAREQRETRGVVPA
jgi:hypothetical protein